jgi:hypothetical protein
MPDGTGVMRGRRLTAISAVVGILFAGALLSVTKVAQAVPNPVRVVATSSSSSQTQRVVFANCPSGLALYGGGAQIIIDSGIRSTDVRCALAVWVVCAFDQMVPPPSTPPRPV